MSSGHPFAPGILSRILSANAQKSAWITDWDGAVVAVATLVQYGDRFADPSGAFDALVSQGLVQPVDGLGVQLNRWHQEPLAPVLNI